MFSGDGNIDYGLIGIIAVAFLGPVLVYLTRYVLKGKTAVASRIWFVSFCTYVVYYYLAKGYYIDTVIPTFYFALLWPIAAILTYWFSERIAARDSPIPFFRWMVYLLAGILFAMVLDIIGGLAGWYSYGSFTETISVPFSGLQVPAIVPLMLGVLLMGVFFLIDNAYEILKKRIGTATTTYVLIGLSFVLGGLVWVVGDFLLGMVK